MDTRILEQLEAVFCREIGLAGCDLGVLESSIKHNLDSLAVLALRTLWLNCEWEGLWRILDIDSFSRMGYYYPFIVSKC